MCVNSLSRETRSWLLLLGILNPLRKEREIKFLYKAVIQSREPFVYRQEA